MRKIIHKIRQKPESVRRFVATSSALVITLVIAFVWISTLGVQNKVTATKKQGTNPFALIKQSFEKAFTKTGDRSQANALSAVQSQESDVTAVTLTPEAGVSGQ
jgi:hypothetical protein